MRLVSKVVVKYGYCLSLEKKEFGELGEFGGGLQDTLNIAHWR